MTRQEFVDALAECCKEEERDVRWFLSGDRLINDERCCPMEYVHDRWHNPEGTPAMETIRKDLELSQEDANAIIAAADKAENNNAHFAYFGLPAHNPKLRQQLFDAVDLGRGVTPREPNLGRHELLQS